MNCLLAGAVGDAWARGERLRPAIDAAYAEHRDVLDRDTRELVDEALALAGSGAPSTP